MFASISLTFFIGTLCVLFGAGKLGDCIELNAGWLKSHSGYFILMTWLEEVDETSWGGCW